MCSWEPPGYFRRGCDEACSWSPNCKMFVTRQKMRPTKAHAIFQNVFRCLKSCVHCALRDIYVQNVMQFIAARPTAWDSSQRNVFRSFWNRFFTVFPAHHTLHCTMHVDRFPIVFYRFFIVFFAPGWARHRFSHDLPLNGLSFFFRFFLPGHDGDRFFIVFLSFFYRCFKRLGYLCSSVFRILPHPLGSAAPPSLSPVVVLSPVL